MSKDERNVRPPERAGKNKFRALKSLRKFSVGGELADLEKTLAMPGLVPGIYVLSRATPQDVDGRDKPGHDEE
jgi:hypothetical protein